MSEQTMQLPQEGDKIGAGIILSLISAGGTAHVYKTWVESLELHRAVKVMNPDAGPEIRARFATEARISSKLVHHNIVHVYNFGETSTGLPYIEMELVSGLTLESVLRQREELPLPVALAVAMGLLDALTYAHSINFTLYDQPVRGIMHRDIKPANVIFSGSVPKLMDFGIARPVAVSMHTMAGTTPGTMAYMAPEIYVSGSSDFRSDVYQIGLLLYECICGRIAYPQTELAPLIEAIKTGTRKPLNTNSKAAAIVKKCLELDPDQRYQTAHECLEDVRNLLFALNPHVSPEAQIQTFFQGAGASTERVEHVKKKKKRKMPKVELKTIIIAIVVTACVTLGLAVNEFLRKGQRPDDGRRTSADSVSAQENASASAPDTSDGRSPPASQAGRAMVTVDASSPLSAEDAAAPPSAKQSAAKPVAAKQSVTSKSAARQPQLTSDDAHFYIAQGKKYLAQNKLNEALASFQQALKTPASAAKRQEIVMLSLYWSARVNTVLYRQGSIPGANYEASWRAVLGAFPAGTPEYNEAVNVLKETNP